MCNKSEIKPEVLSIDKLETKPDGLVPKCTITRIKSIEGVGRLGLYFMPVGEQTNVFSMEYEDDGTAEEFYGPCNEFYYIVCGGFTMYWGKDASKIRAGTSEKLVLRAGDLGYWTPGWKYAVKNTGNVPGIFFWGITLPPKGTKTRQTTYKLFKLK